MRLCTVKVLTVSVKREEVEGYEESDRYRLALMVENTTRGLNAQV